MAARVEVCDQRTFKAAERPELNFQREANVWCHANWNFSSSLNLVEKLFYAACRKFIELSQYAQTRSKEMRAKLVWNPKSWKKWGPRSETLIYSRFFSLRRSIIFFQFWSPVKEPLNLWTTMVNRTWIGYLPSPSPISLPGVKEIDSSRRSDTFIFSSFYFALFASILD